MRAPGPLSPVLGGAAALAAVTVASLILAAVGADQTAAALALVVVGVLLTLVGPAAAVVGIIASFLSLNFFFMPPTGAFGIEKVDDLVALATLAITTGVLGTTIARADRLRRRADRREQEVRTRLVLARRISDGDDPGAVVGDAETALRRLFDAPELTIQRSPTGELTVDLGPGDPLAAEARDEIAAFLVDLGTALDRARLAEAVRDAEVATAVEAGRAAFLAAMTHNLRTPLATIKVAVSTLLTAEAQSRDPDASALLRAAYEESDRLERLVNKVLALSRIRAGSIVVELEAIDIAEVAQAAVQRVGILAGGRPVELEAPPALLLARVDAELLEVVLVNLLENALRHAPRGRVLIAGRHHGQRVVLSVEDEGPGIAPEDRERAFEEFVRLGGGADTSGTGIGLTIARELVIAQRGTIVLGERPGGGARVTMTFEAA